MTDPQRADRRHHSTSGFWTPLVLRTLPHFTDQLSDWTVIKNHTSQPVVSGGIGLCVPRHRWDDFVRRTLAGLEWSAGIDA
jgi:hypothetical protein